MALLNLKYDLKETGTGHKHLTLSLKELQRFNSGMLDLGSPAASNTCINAMAVFLDLQGFTSFCSQIDSQLVVPAYLKNMHSWLFSEVSARFVKEMTDEGAVLWGKFPFFAKFLGDGILMLWETDGLGPASLGNIVVNLFKVCDAFKNEFVPQIEADFVRPPKVLRCGIARGEVISIGGGKDFVGSCMNMAARLQQVQEMTFAFARKGFDPKSCFSEAWQEQFTLCKTDIRGIGKEELVFFLKREVDSLPPDEKLFIKELGSQ
jgi:hypothetical protein